MKQWSGSGTEAMKIWRIEHEGGHFNSDRKHCPLCCIARTTLEIALRAFQPRKVG